MQPKGRSIHTRPSTMPAYYLGRPADLWMTIPGGRWARAAVRRTAERTSDAGEPA